MEARLQSEEYRIQSERDRMREELQDAQEKAAQAQRQLEVVTAASKAADVDAAEKQRLQQLG